MVNKNRRKLFGVAGSPISHSLSPFMHQYWLKDEGLNHLYRPFHVKDQQLGNFIQAAEETGLSGFNVTFPLKRKILDFLDDAEETAVRLAAVNTVIRKSNKWFGLNTDGKGFLAGLNASFPELLSKPALDVLVIGAGGAGRAISHTLLSYPGLTQTVANRTAERVRSLLSATPSGSQIYGKTLCDAEKELDRYDLIINTTSAGFSSQEGLLPIKLDHLSPHTAVVDIIYNPLETAFLKKARENGNPAVNGLPMLIHQGALSFQHWHGLKPDTKTMEYLITKKMEENYAHK